MVLKSLHIGGSYKTPVQSQVRKGQPMLVLCKKGGFYVCGLWFAFSLGSLPAEQTSRAIS